VGGPKLAVSGTSQVCVSCIAGALIRGHLFVKRGVVRQGWRDIGRSLSILAVGLTLGLLVSLSWRPSDEGRVAAIDPGSSQIWRSIDRLELEQQQLKTTLSELRQDLAERQQAAAANTDRLQALSSALEEQQLLAGLTSLQGPGVLVVLDDSTVQIPPGADPNGYIIHEYDLRDIVNLLWTAGSEAIAINDERLVGNSSLYCVGSTVMVNNTRLSPPYRIRAIGNSRVQQDYLRNPSYLQDLKQKQRSYGLRFDVEAITNLVLPAYSGGFLVEYARPGG
jgi:uncharacterized protein YlxW (UPF0749 family)